MSPHSRFRTRLRPLVTAVVGGALVISLAAPAGAQTTPDSTTTTAIATVVTAPPDSTTTNTTPVAPTTITVAPTTTTIAPNLGAVAPFTTTTVASPPAPGSSAAVVTPPWATNVPPPPPPPPPPAGATPAEIAQAGQLEAQIRAQSDALDVAAEKYDQAEAVLQTARSHLGDVQAQLAAGTDRANALQASLGSAQVALKQAAVDAYIDGGVPPGPALTGGLIDAYERQKNQVLAASGVARAAARVNEVHAAQLQLQAAQQDLAADQQKAQGDSVAAQTAADAAQGAAQSAALQDAQLLTTIALLKGNLAQLVAAADALQAQAAYQKYATLGLLDFVPHGPLGAPLPSTPAAVQAALAQLGKPYVWGATGPASFDCSGLTEWSWLQAGVLIPRVAADQQKWATPVPISQLQPGDFVFFGSPAHHVGMYVGNGKMVNAPHSGASVEVVPIWWNDLAGFGRAHLP